MAAFSFDVSAFSRMSQDIQKFGERVSKNERTAVALAGQAYSNDVKAAITALGLYVTGDYRRRVHVEMRQEGLHWVAYIGTDAPQARRLEYGFWDMIDKLGRHFMQYPRPHWRPTWDANLDRYVRIMMAALNGDAMPEWVDYGAEKREDLSDMMAGASNFGISIPRATRAKRPANIWSKVSTTYRRSSPGRSAVKK